MIVQKIELYEEMAGTHALWPAMRVKDEDFMKPILASSMHLFFETCHAQFKGWSQWVATPIRASGAVAKEFMHAGKLYFWAS